MHTDHDPIDPEELLKLGYEHRDVPPKPMAWAAFWLFAFTLGSGILGALFIRFWNIVPEVPVEQRAFHKVQPPVGTPLLQNNSDNTADIAALRKHEAEVATSKKVLPDGSYQIPIDDALKIVVQRGLPKTGTLPVTHPTVTASGQVLNPVPNPPMSNPASPAGGTAVPDSGMPQPKPLVIQKPPANAGAKKQ